MNNDITPRPAAEPTVHTPPITSVPPTNPVAQPMVTPQVTPLPATTNTGGGSSASDDGPSGWRDFVSTVGILATALLVALLMIGFVFRSYQVDGPSMQQTLQNQDKLIIWKVPRTWARLTHHAYIPNRGDVIVFTESGLGQFGQEDSKQLIKRVIGLPGDRVVVQNGTVTIYNSEHPNGFKPDDTLGYKYANFPTTSGDIDITLKADQLFACGDNRPNSLDSRAFGPISANQVIGKLVVRVFPTNQIKTF
ncbi:MAG: signal peptidase I [Patescibacteria group bacterium]|nr:signal peptidase I [Patescibacteria group bacterium]